MKSFKYPLEIHKFCDESFCYLMAAMMISVGVKTWSTHGLPNENKKGSLLKKGRVTFYMGR